MQMRYEHDLTQYDLVSEFVNVLDVDVDVIDSTAKLRSFLLQLGPIHIIDVEGL